MIRQVWNEAKVRWLLYRINRNIRRFSTTMNALGKAAYAAGAECRAFTKSYENLRSITKGSSMNSEAVVASAVKALTTEGFLRWRVGESLRAKDFKETYE